MNLTPMRSIASAIVILTSCGMFLSVAAFIRHVDTAMFLNVFALAVGVAGLWGFVQSIKADNPK